MLQHDKKAAKKRGGRAETSYKPRAENPLLHPKEEKNEDTKNDTKAEETTGETK